MQRLTVEWAKRAAAVAEANLSTVGVDPKQGRKTTMKLNEAIKGMQVESWEAREHSSGNGPYFML